MAVYLVDFENVHSEGLTGVKKLGENDECYIFYSVNACSLSFDLHQKIIESKAKFYYKMVDAHGKNALDFQLVTFLGYLVAKHPDEHFYVVSGDKMFCCATDYWCKENVNADVLEDFSELLFMNSNEKNISDYIGQMLTNSYERVLTQRAYRRMPSLTQTQEYLTSKLGKRRAREIRNLLSPVADCRYDSERLRLFKENNVFEKIGKHGLNENEMIVVEECLKKKIDKKQFNNILSKHFGTIRGGEVYRIVHKIVGEATIDEVISVPVKDSADAANIASQQVSETEINEVQNVTESENADVRADAQEELPAEKRVPASNNGLEAVLDDEDECNFVNKCISELITVRGITRRITVKYGKDRAEQIIAIIQPFLSNKRGR